MSYTGPTVNVASPGGAAAGLFAQVSAYGYLRVTAEPGLLFSDGFDGTTVDTTNRWTQTGVVTQANGGALIGGAAAGLVASLVSQPVFPPMGLNLNALGYVASYEPAALANNVARFHGFGVHTGTPTAAVPVTDGVGFELDGAGKLWAAVWVNGARSAASVDLTSKFVAGATRYGILTRSDLAIFYLGSTDVPVATISFVTPAVQSLPARFQQITQGTVTSVPSTLVQAVAVHDTGKNTTGLSDGASPWRKANVGRYGGLSIKGSAMPAVSTSFAANAPGTTPAYDVSEAGNVTFIIKNQVAGTPYGLGGVVGFEQSDDGVSWAPLLVVRSSDGAAVSSSPLGANTANASLMFDAGMEGVNWVRARLLAPVTTAGVTITILAGGMPFAPSVSVLPQPITKGIQAAAGFTTQDLKDAGRSAVILSTVGLTSTTTEALGVFSGFNGSTAVTTGALTQYTVTAGKRLRVQAIRAKVMFAAPSTTVTFGSNVLRLRAATTGTLAVTSSVALPIRLDTASNLPGVEAIIPIPDGLEFPSGAVIGFSQVASAAGLLTDFALIGYEY